MVESVSSVARLWLWALSARRRYRSRLRCTRRPTIALAQREIAEHDVQGHRRLTRLSTSDMSSFRTFFAAWSSAVMTWPILASAIVRLL